MNWENRWTVPSLLWPISFILKTNSECWSENHRSRLAWLYFDVCWCSLDRPDLIEGKKRNPPRNWRGLFRFVSLLNTDVVNFSNEPQKIKMNAFAQKSNSEISDANLPIQNKKKEFHKICLLAARRDPHKKQTAKDQIFLFLSPTMSMNFGCRCGSSYVHFHVLGVQHLHGWEVWFSQDEEIKIPNVDKVARRKVMSNPRSKIIRLLPSRCAWVLLFAENNQLAQHVVVANLNEQNRVSKNKLIT